MEACGVNRKLHALLRSVPGRVVQGEQGRAEHAVLGSLFDARRALPSARAKARVENQAAAFPTPRRRVVDHSPAIRVPHGKYWAGDLLNRTRDIGGIDRETPQRVQKGANR